MLGTASIPVASLQCRRWLGAFILLTISVSSRSFAQQPPPNTHAARQTAAAAPGLRQIEQLIQRGQLDEARNLIEDQLKRDPANVEAYNLLGIVFTNQKDYARALDAFQQALKIDPVSPSTHNNLGNLYVAQQNPDAAEKEFTKVLKSAPANRDAHYNLGLLLLAKGSPGAAISHFQQVHPQTVEARFNLVRAYFAAGKTTAALQQAHELSAARKQDV
ncbi:MAG TPA: tetratricopeptide repeat protein, partial [Candidatus Sulfotelmatobacter sp.]|nr:tetratricopeptide repeat protein [Candidatus Sulfotelmatobacter sp.]